MRIADAIADWLSEKHITHAFGIVGGGNAVLFDAIQKQGKITIVCCHHEQAAAMASAYFNRTNGKLASVVLVTTGAGSTNAITGVMAAWMDSIPLLVLSGNDPSKYLNSDTRVLGTQAYESSALARSFTKSAARATSENIWGTLQWAHGRTTEARQGPCWVDIPKDVQNATI